jgi:hypothetical protein
MVTRPDLVEAQAFDRCRLLIAFVGGPSGGKLGVEPTSAGPAVLAGIVLACLLLLGSAIAGQVADRTMPDQAPEQATTIHDP